MLSGSLAFTLMGALTHALGSSCDWRIIALVRTSLALVLVAGLAFASGVQLVFWRPGTLWLRSLAGSVSLVCTFFALTRLPISEVLTLTNMFPIWVALLSWPLLHERPPGRLWLALASGLAGVVLIEQPRFGENTLATAAALVSSMSTAVAMIGLHRLQHINTKAIVVHFSAVALGVCLFTLVLFHRLAPLPEQLGGNNPVMLLGVGIAAAIGQLFLTKAFAGGSPAKVSVVGLSQIGFAIPLDIVFWDRTFDAATLLGIALIGAPTAWLLAMSTRPPQSNEFPA
jgi:drug/metabolite transporter (DMT)-like permease